MPVSTHRVRHCVSSADPLDFIQALYASRVVIFKPSSRFIDTCENGGGVR